MPLSDGSENSDIWNGYMDGAVRTGRRAADEILAELSWARVRVGQADESMTLSRSSRERASVESQMCCSARAIGW
jgi:hypothetical protein